MPKRFFWIDVLRGLAALAVLISHYPHFYLTSPSGHHTLPETTALPFATVLGLIYDHGGVAVPVFWMISGFVFFHIYHAHPVSARRFAIARIARLYPMHFATLILVACIQITSLRLTGQAQIYGNADLPHFALNLIMASHWTVYSDGLSFNGPIWSVSLELLVYGLFFLCVVQGRLRSGRVMAGLALMAGLASTLGQEALPVLRIGILTCAWYFFAGAALYRGVCRMPAGALSLALICAVMGGLRLMSSLDMLSILLLGTCLILAAALLDMARCPAPRPLTHLGDISYSLYLIHVPIQMIWLLGADLWFDGSRAFAASPLTLGVYVGLALATASFSFRLYERPAQQIVRRWLTAPQPGWVPPLATRSS